MNYFVVALLALSVALTGCGTSTRSLAYLNKHPEISADKKEAIKSRELTIGMDRDTVRHILGKPKRTEAYTVIDDTFEEWRYGAWPFSTIRLKFKNGELVEWRSH